MDYNYKKYTHRHKTLKSATNYLSRFYDSLALDYDGESVYGSTIKNLVSVKQLCDNISSRIDTIISRNSKELNEIKYVYLSIINSLGTFTYLNYHDVVEVSKQIDTTINKVIAANEFSYDLAEQLPTLVLKTVLLYSIKSTEYEYVSYLHSLDISAVDVSGVLSNSDIATTVLFALTLYRMLWEHKFKSMGKYHSRYYLNPDSMYDFLSGFSIVSRDVFDYYDNNKDDKSLIEGVGIR